MSFRLLLIDDDASMVRLLARIIQSEFGDQIELESLTDPADALRRLGERYYDMLITDLEMPGVDGLALLRCAKKRNAWTQVMFVTGKASQDTLLSAMELGAADYLIKPVQSAELLMLVRQAFDRQRRWREALADSWRKRREAELTVLGATASTAAP